MGEAKSRRPILWLAVASFLVALISSVIFLESFRTALSDSGWSSVASVFTAEVTRLPRVTWAEIVGFVTGVLSVYLVTKQDILAWPIGIVMVVTYTWVYYEYRLFGDMALMQVYLVMQIHGWWAWLHGGPSREPLVARFAPRIVLAAVILWTGIGTWFGTPVLVALKGSAPFWDSFTTIASLGAQYLLNRKFIENWVIWIVVDLVYVPLYLSRGLYATAVLYLVFLALAIIGLREWLKSTKSTDDSRVESS